MRALFLYPTLTVGGAERHLAHLVRALRDREVDSTIVTLKHEGRFFQELRADGFPVHFAAMRTRIDLRGARRAHAIARSARPDLVVTQSIDAQVIGHAISRRLGLPHLTIEHGGPGLRRAPHRRFLLRLVAPHIDGVVAITSAQVAGLRAFGFPPERIVVIPNGTTEPLAPRSRADVRADLGFDPDAVLVLLAATLRPEKRASLFVDAVAHARASAPSTRGIVAGAGPDFDAVRAHAELVGSTLLLGERDDVPDLISAADLVCLTSVAEGLPMVVLEAMALGRPIVATAVGGIPEVVTPEIGVVVEDATAPAIGRAIASLAAQPELRRAMGDRGRLSYLANFTVERMADDYVAVMRRLVAHGAMPGGSRRRGQSRRSGSPIDPRASAD